jgi:hypothetical protein
MVFLRLMTALALSLAVTALSQAQTRVYESTDDEGNTVFSDTPSEGAKSMEIPQTNVATPVEPAATPVQSQSGDSPVSGEVVEASEEHPRIIVDGEEERREGDRWRTEHTEDGDILTQQSKPGEGDRWRTEHTEDGDILTQQPKPGEGEEGSEPGQRHRVEKHPTHKRGRH